MEETNVSMELDKKIQIMKMEITRFFKNNGFTKHYKGYIKNVNHLIIKVNVFDISETEKTGKFKIMIGIRPEKAIELSRLSHVLGFMDYVIPKGKSFITITENTNTEELRICVRNYLNDILSILNIYNDAEKIIKELQMEIDQMNNAIIEIEDFLKKESGNSSAKTGRTILRKKIEIIDNYIKAMSLRRCGAAHRIYVRGEDHE